MIVKRKILIYDTSRGYYRFIKLNFEREFEIINFFDLDISLVNYFDAIIFIANESIELIDFISLYKKTTTLFLGTGIVEIKNKLKNIDDVIFLDLQQKRSEMIDFIRYNFNVSGVLEGVVA